jgi:glycosyltransferase involved in cell wall biosynthesis
MLLTRQSEITGAPSGLCEMQDRVPTLDENGVVFLRYWGSHFKTRRQARCMAAEFRPIVERGWHCHLVLEHKPDEVEWLQPLLDLGVELHLEPRPRGKYDFRCMLRVRRLCRHLQADIFVCDNIHMSSLLGAAAARVRVRIWIKRAMNSSYEEVRVPGLKERIAVSTRLSCFLATRVISVSGAVKDELVALGIAPSKLLVRLNPRRLGASLKTGDRSSVRRSHGYSEQDVVITTVGHAVPVKGWDLLLRAFARVSVAEPAARLLFIGGFERPEETEFYKQLRQEIARSNLESSIVFAGHVENVAQLLSAADLFVMPSRSEGSGTALIEALEAGLPAIATRVGIAEQVIVPGVNGFLVERGDEQRLAEAIIHVAGDKRLREALAAGARVPDCVPDLPGYAEGMMTDYAALLGTKRHRVKKVAG